MMLFFFRQQVAVQCVAFPAVLRLHLTACLPTSRLTVRRHRSLASSPQRRQIPLPQLLLLLLLPSPAERTSNLLAPCALQPDAQTVKRKSVLPEVAVIDDAPVACTVGRLRQRPLPVGCSSPTATVTVGAAAADTAAVAMTSFPLHRRPMRTANWAKGPEIVSALMQLRSSADIRDRVVGVYFADSWAVNNSDVWMSSIQLNEHRRRLCTKA